MSENVILAIAGIITAAISILGSWLVARLSKKATDKTSEVQKEANAVAGFHELVGDLRTEVIRLRGDVDALRGELDKTNTHVKVLEQERSRDKSLIRHLVNYCRVLRDALRALGQPVPEAPAGLDLEGGPLT